MIRFRDIIAGYAVIEFMRASEKIWAISLAPDIPLHFPFFIGLIGSSFSMLLAAGAWLLIAGRDRW